MDFDHVREKRADISRMILQDYPLSTVLAEIELCDLVCANCHRIRSWKRWQLDMAQPPEIDDLDDWRCGRERQTVCKRGHKLKEPNLRKNSEGRLQCMACAIGCDLHGRRRGRVSQR